MSSESTTAGNSCGATAATGDASDRRTANSNKMNPARVIGANDRINVAVIGTGGRGGYVPDRFDKYGEDEQADACQIVAVCDVYQKRVNSGQRALQVRWAPGLPRGAEPQGRRRGRSSPRRTTGTPRSRSRRWTQGKDVYLEKPMCHTIEEAKQLVDTVKETKRVLQVGSQTTSGDQWWKAQQGDRRRHDRPDAHEPGLLSPQLDRRRVELDDRPGRRPGRQGRRLHRLEDVARAGARSAPSTPTASSASASTGITRAASRPTCSSTWWRR